MVWTSALCKVMISRVQAVIPLRPSPTPLSPLRADHSADTLYVNEGDRIPIMLHLRTYNPMVTASFPPGAHSLAERAC
jgi:hypothetical protein